MFDTKMWKLKCLCLVLTLPLGICTTQKPNIIVIVADDMGFNDVGFHGSDEIPTPNIDALAYNGVILNSHYTQALCTPSRSAFLTGKYPIHLGMQHLVILEPEPWGLPLNETLLPQHLQRNGYSTHAIGKWHLGFFKKEYTPTFRGFDTHFGYWQGLQDYYEHTVHATFTPEFGYDMRRNMTVDWSAKGQYSTTLFTEEAVKLIKEHDVDKPMFMYLAHLAPHTGNDYEPLQAPDEEIAKFSYIADPERRIYAAMVSMLDKSVGSVVSALSEKRMLHNSIILFMSDNGGQTQGIHANHGSNYPLRGMKNSPWEGAMRCVAAVWSPLIKKPQRISNELIHLSDWLPTLYSAAGLNASELGGIDGVDVWQSISENIPGPREELLHNIDDIDRYGALRQGDWKYIYGTTGGGKRDDWYGVPGELLKDNYYDINEILTSPTAHALAGVLTYKQVNAKLNKTEDNDFSVRLLSVDDIRNLRDSAQVRCNALEIENIPESNLCRPLISPCLFNIKEDPCERLNMADQQPDIVNLMKLSIDKYRESSISPRNVPRDPNADPARFNNTWTNWGDYEVVEKHKIHVKTLSPLAIALISSGCVSFLVIAIALLIISSKKARKTNQPDPLFDERLDNPLNELSLKTRHFEDQERQKRNSLRMP